MTERRILLPVVAAYDRWSANYDEYDNPMVFAASRIVEFSLRDVRGRDIVEFGCGTGRNLEMLRSRGAQSLVGSDVSRGMLARAAQRPGNFQLFESDMGQPLPLPPGSMDVALFCLSLEHVADLASAFIEAKRLLRAGGTLMIIEIHPFLTASGVSAHYLDGNEEVRMPTVAHDFSSYVDALLATDFRITACREWRPRDLGSSLPVKVLMRGPNLPLVLQFTAHALA
jgi:malonyl-CoA O-methyltransferase